MAKRIGLMTIILFIGFAFFVAVSVPAQTVEHSRAICVHASARAKNNQTCEQEQQNERAYLLGARETHSLCQKAVIRRQKAKSRRQMIALSDRHATARGTVTDAAYCLLLSAFCLLIS